MLERELVVGLVRPAIDAVLHPVTSVCRRKAATHREVRHVALHANRTTISMKLSTAEYLAGLKEPSARAARESFCSYAAESIQSCGNVLWAFGVAEGRRRSLATMVQMAGRLASGASTLLTTENWYATAALMRQFIEVEYLVWMMNADTPDATNWLASSQDDFRRIYAPNAMRKRSGGKFRDSEYWSHCEIGGHPNPRAGFLLPERVFPADQHPFGDPFWMWLDAAQHFGRFWESASQAFERHDLADIVIVKTRRAGMATAIDTWHEADPCSGWIIDLPASASRAAAD